MRDLPLQALRALAMVHETGGVRAAAERLGVSHSAVSRRLTELEAWLGFPVAEGAARRALVLTPQGRALAEATLKALRSLDAAAAAARELRRPNAVVIATTPSFALLWLLPRLPDLQAALPWIEVSVHVEQRLADPPEGVRQLNIRMGRGPWPGLRAEPFMDETLFPVLSPGLWRSAGEPEDSSALARLPLIHDRDPFTPWSLWFERFPATGVDPRRGARFSSPDALFEAAVQGAGVALARGRLAQRSLESGQLVRPCGDAHVSLTNAYWIVEPPGSSRPAAVDAVVRWLRRQALLD